MPGTSPRESNYRLLRSSSRVRSSAQSRSPAVSAIRARGGRFRVTGTGSPSRLALPTLSSRSRDSYQCSRRRTAGSHRSARRARCRKSCRVLAQGSTTFVINSRQRGMTERSVGFERCAAWCHAGGTPDRGPLSCRPVGKRFVAGSYACHWSFLDLPTHILSAMTGLCVEQECGSYVSWWG